MTSSDKYSPGSFDFIQPENNRSLREIIDTMKGLYAYKNNATRTFIDEIQEPTNEQIKACYEALAARPEVIERYKYYLIFSYCDGLGQDNTTFSKHPPLTIWDWLDNETAAGLDKWADFPDDELGRILVLPDRLMKDLGSIHMQDHGAVRTLLFELMRLSDHFDIDFDEELRIATKDHQEYKLDRIP